MSVFINGIGIVSPLPWDNSGTLSSPTETADRYLKCMEPDYGTIIPPMYLRRMSRILRMGSAAAVLSLRDAKIEKPQAILTGTGYGCLEDTTTFLTQITTQQETALNPTPFMQSTHNTIASQIAIMVKCDGYNQTYAHHSFSFEHAMLDALLMLSEKPAMNLLLGGVDEWTPTRHAIEDRFGMYDRPGRYLPGEGATFFTLSGTKHNTTIAALVGVSTFGPGNKESPEQRLAEFLTQSGVDASEIDLVLAGYAPESHAAGFPHDTLNDTLSKSSIGFYKNMCGEYSTASAFGVALAATIIRTQHIPAPITVKDKKRRPATILVCSEYCEQVSYIVLRQCQHGEN